MTDLPATALTQFRQELHRWPELGLQETQTQRRILAFLESHGVTTAAPIAGTGVLCRFDSGVAGPCLLVRVDIDALPIQEINTFPHRSRVDGVSHMCGHDGHTTIGAGLAIHLTQSPPTRGRIDVLFQPAEETGEGAAAVLADPTFDVSVYEFAVALHNIPGLPLGTVICRCGSFTPSVHSLILRFHGKTAHAALPLTGINPAYAMAEIIAWAQASEQTEERHPDFHLITPIFQSLGSHDYGVAAGHGELHLTIRSWEQQRRDEVTQLLLHQIKAIADRYRLPWEFSQVASFDANQNHPDVVAAIRRAAEHCQLPYQDKSDPFPWGEDFGLFTQNVPGAMFGLGAGEATPVIHNPDYEYPDALTPDGIRMFAAVAEVLTGNKLASIDQ